MKDLSAGVLVAWQIAAIESSVAKHQFIEKEQILIGICSLEKVLLSRGLNLNLYHRDIQDIKLELESIEQLLHKYKLDPTYLRRKIRKNYERGNFKHKEKVIHRSEECKEYFKRAKVLAENSNKIKCLHLFAAILEHPEGVITEILKEKNINPEEIHEKALFFERISQKQDENNSYVI